MPFPRQVLPFAGRAARQTQIEGLRHGGVAQVLRKTLTEFGSGWRGVISLPSAFFPNGTEGISVGSSWIDQQLRRNPAVTPEIRKTLEQGRKWTAQTGHFPVFINQDIKGAGYRYVANTIRHERIHQVERRNMSSPFFEQERSKLGSLADVAASRHVEDMTRYRAKKGLFKRLTLPDWQIRQKSKREGRETAAFYDAYYERAGKGVTAKEIAIDSERLAYGNQADRGFFPRLKAAGLQDPRIAARPSDIASHRPVASLATEQVAAKSSQSTSRVVKQVMESGESRNVVGGFGRKLLQMGSRVFRGV